MSLTELLDVKAVALDVPCADWQAAVRAAGDALVASGVATDTYTDAMVDTVERLGPYIVIAPGLALAHARPSEAVLRTGVSWVRPAEPVSFGHAKNDPVELVVGLAATDHELHQAALVELATAFSNPVLRRRLAEAATVEELMDVLDHNQEEGS